MSGQESNSSPAPIGQAWLRRELNLRVPAPATESHVIAGTRRTEVHGRHTYECYPRTYGTGNSVVANLRFALRHEPTDLGVLAAAFKVVEPTELEEWVRREPTGAYARRAWFFYEHLTGRTLDAIPPRPVMG